MNRAAFFLSLLLTVGLSEYTTPFHRAIAHESGKSHTESSGHMTQGKGNHTAPLFNHLGNRHHPTSANVSAI